MLGWRKFHFMSELISDYIYIYIYIYMHQQPIQSPQFSEKGWRLSFSIRVFLIFF